jgi:hypothetical protein
LCRWTIADAPADDLPGAGVRRIAGRDPVSGATSDDPMLQGFSA